VLGTREQYEAMNRFVEEKGDKPVLDEQVFGFEEAKEAYTYLSQYRHFSKYREMRFIPLMLAECGAK
ncbi:hypothetical protein KEM56_002647, partial [Ascosphaera pollenicola]